MFVQSKGMTHLIYPVPFNRKLNAFEVDLLSNIFYPVKMPDHHHDQHFSNLLVELRIDVRSRTDRSDRGH